MAIFGLISFMLLGLLFQSAGAQMTIVMPAKGDSLQISWTHDWKDTTGHDERVAKFNVYVSKNDADFEFVGGPVDADSTGKPSTRWTVHGIGDNNKYVIGVTAVDYAGNESALHHSMQVTAAYGGWYVIIDRIPPRVPGMLKPEN